MRPVLPLFISEKKPALLFCIAWILFIPANAQNGLFYKTNNGWQISNYNTPLDTVKDDLYDDLINPSSGWRNYYINGTPDNFVKLLLADSNTTAFSYNFLVKVTAWNSAGTQSTFNVTIPLSFDPLQYKSYRDVSVHRFKGAHKFVCNILSVSDAVTGSAVTFSNLKKRFRVQQVIQANRYVKSSYSEIVDESDITHSRPEPGKIKIDWSNTTVKSPTLFELEWMHVDNYGGTYDDYLMDHVVFHQGFKDTTGGYKYGWYNANSTTNNISDNCLYFEDLAAMNNFVLTTPGRKYVLMARVKYCTPGKEVLLTVFDDVAPPDEVAWVTGDDFIVNDFTANADTTHIAFEGKDAGLVCKIDDLYLIDVTDEQDPDEPYYKPLDKLAYDFKNNATRIRTSATDYTIEDVFENGYVLYRIRRVRPDSLDRITERFSPWSPADENGFADAYPKKIAVGAHTADILNWNYQVSYAEEGKRKDVVGYYDGLLKPRQQVAVSNAEKTVIVGETKYDFNGRAAVQILPVPALRNDDDTLYYNKLDYYPAFNLNLADKPYSASDFDSLRWVCPGDTAGMLSDVSGASHYYSPNNFDLGGPQKYVPDAGLYPMVHTEFMPDNTGRVRRQGGVGADHQLGSGHETFYDYSQPEQTELDRLFGSETGKFSHYKKQTVTDANGQVSVSYMDMQGRVVATALAGPSPASLDSLHENSGSRLMFSSLNDKNTIEDNELRLTYEKTLVKDGPLYIDYRMQTSAFKDACLPVNLCFKCVYNYEITLVNKECNRVIFTLTDTIGFLDAADTLCGELADIQLTDHLLQLKETESSIDTFNNTIMLPSLGKGTYALIKRLYVNPGAYSFYFEAYRDKLTCAKPFEVFFQQALDSTDFSVCDPCDTCETDNYGYCDAMLDLMKSDVSPGGQYCQFETDEDGFIQPLDTVTSVLKSTRYPTIKNYTVNGITDRITLANGNTDSVWKADVHHFVTNFKMSWADSLVKFHPEYPYYVYCHDSLAASYDYDFDRNALDNYDSAYIKGYLNPTNITGIKTAYPYAAAGRDPYFYTHPALKASMNSKMLQYKKQGDTIYTIWDMAATQAFCGQLADEKEIYPCMEAFRNRKVLDSMYFNPALRQDFLDAFQNLYTSAKQVIIDSMMKAYAGEPMSVSPYTDKIKRYYTGYSDGLSRPASDESLASQISNMAGIEAASDSTCYYNSVKWLNSLSGCPNVALMNAGDLIIFRQALQDFCQESRFGGSSPNLFAVSSIPPEVPATYHSIQELLNDFYDMYGSSSLAMTDPACSRFLLKDLYEPGHSFSQEEADSKCDCVTGKELIPPRVKIQPETEDEYGSSCIRDSVWLTDFGLGLKNLLNVISASSASMRRYTLLMDSTVIPFRDYLEPNGIREDFLAYEFRQTYPGGQSVHQWRLNFSDDIDKAQRCNIFFNLNDAASRALFSFPNGTFSFSATGDDSFQVNYEFYDPGIMATQSVRFKGMSMCGEIFNSTCVEFITTDTTYGVPFSVDSTELDSFMAFTRLIRNGSLDNLMTEYMSGEGCVDDIEQGKNCSQAQPASSRLTLSDLVQVMNESMLMGRLFPEKFNDVTHNKDSFYHGIKINGEEPYVNYTLDSLSFTYASKFAIEWNFCNGYKYEGPTPDAEPFDCYYENNFAKDPYFIGVSVFGAIGDGFITTNCQLSYGAPYGNVPLASIDTFVNLRIDPALRMWVADGYALAAPNKKYVITLNASCFGIPEFCSDFAVDSVTKHYTRTFVEQGESSFKYSFSCRELDRFYSQGHDGSCPGASFNEVMLDMKYTPFFLQNVLNKKAAEASGNYYPPDVGGPYDDNALTRPNPFNIDTFNTAGIPPVLATMMNNKFGYYPERITDSLLMIYLGDTGALSGCQLSLRLLEGDGLFSFGSIDSFYNIRPDEEKLKEHFLAGSFENGGHYFTINAFKDSASGYNYKLRGWLSCMPVYNCIEIDSATKSLAADNRCGCATCPEVKGALEAFEEMYPGLLPNGAMYPELLTRHLNNALNNNLNYDQYRDFISQCRFTRGEELPAVKAGVHISAAGIGSAFPVVLDFLKGQRDSFGYYIPYTLETDPGSSSFRIDLSSVPETARSFTLGKLIYAFNFFNYDGAVLEQNYVSECGLTITLADSSGCYSGFGDYLDTAICDRFGLTLPGEVTVQRYVPDYTANQVDLTAGELHRWCLDLSGKSLTEKNDIYGVIDSALKYCRYAEYTANFELIRDNYSDSLVIFRLDTAYLGIQDTVCESCNEIYDKVLKFQDEVWLKKPGYVRESILPEQIRNHLRNWYGYKTNVYELPAANPLDNGKQLAVCATSAQGEDFAAVLRYAQHNSGIFTGSTNLGHEDYPAIIDISEEAPDAHITPVVSAGILYDFHVTFTLAQGSSSCTFTLDGDSVMLGIDTIFGIESYPGNSDKFLLLAGTQGVIKRYEGTSSCYRLSACCTFKKPTLCFRPYFETIVPDTGACRRELTEQARSNALYAYAQYTDSLKLAFNLAYNKACIDSAQSKEQVSIGSYFNEYHYTLYYYDIAGNLVKTVPPAGVDTLNVTPQLALQLRTNRNVYQQGNHVYTNHKLSTNYRYNSLGQVRYQKTPDAGESRFYYDALGRLALSQSSRQAAQGNVYSYTVRDALNRVTEVGEIVSTAVDEDSLRFLFNAYFPGWLARGYRTQITRTFYDTSYSAPVNSLFAGGQQYLRSRVSTVAYYEYNVSAYAYATHYSYDIHGNVDVLVQDYPELQGLGNRYKYIHYLYDLVSGKVNMVRYQPGQPDRFYHRYDYDADNRLREVYTSSDSIIWSNDAGYSYYKHGPLARTTLGEYNVQGIDYAYTIHGWLKGVNSATLDSTRDMGNDGYTNTSFASDVFGFTLGYYNGDYKPVDGNYYNTAIAFVANPGSSPLAQNGLYNGNISHMVTAVRPLMSNNKPMASVYTYDQLNRITRMETYTDVNTGTNTWNSGSTASAYLSTFGYDPNGNIKYLFRNGLSGIMDSLNYAYYPGTNRLKQVSDNVNSASYPDDIDNQGNDNYQYDLTGNLAKDLAEEIDSIEWNVYGKIRHIRRDSSSTKPSLEFKYDASGQRAVKVVKNGKSENTWTRQYYVRDAQGNVMATYNTRSYVANDALNIAAVTDWIFTNKGTDSLVALMQDKFSSNTGFTALLNERLMYNGKGQEVLSNYSLDEILGWDNSLAGIIVVGISTNSISNQQDFLQQLISYDKNTFMSALANCPGVNEGMMLSAFYSDNTVLEKSLISLCNNGFRTPLESICMMLGINYQICDPSPPFTCVPVSCEELAMNMTAYPDRLTLVNQLFSMVGFSNCMLAIGNACSDVEIYNPLDPATSMYNFSALAGNISNCVSGPHLSTFFTGSYSNTALAKDILVAGVNNYILNLAITYDADRFIQYGIEADLTSLNETLAGLSGFDIAQYMNMVKLRWGQPAYEALASNMIFTQQVKLGEHHLYGSSRLGIKYADTTLFQRDITINGFDTLGNILVDDVLDSVKLQVDTVRYYNMLALKQYELTNHLGNVLATVNDRKTPVIVSSALVGYRADVVSATYYYPFGSAMQTWGNDSGYKFGFNGKEKDDEGLGGGGSTYDYGFRIYNANLGRFLSIDPLTSSYPFYTPYQFAGNKPIKFSDLDGLEEKKEGTVTELTLLVPELKVASWKRILETRMQATFQDDYIPIPPVNVDPAVGYKQRANAVYKEGFITFTDYTQYKSDGDNISVLYHEYNHYLNDIRGVYQSAVDPVTNQIVQWQTNNTYVRYPTQSEINKDLSEWDEYIGVTMKAGGASQEDIQKLRDQYFSDISKPKTITLYYSPSNLAMDEIISYKNQLLGEELGFYTLSDSTREDIKNRIYHLYEQYNARATYEEENNLNPDGTQKGNQ